jgi:uncharacterized protein (TIRG00374 family)
MINTGNRPRHAAALWASAGRLLAALILLAGVFRYRADLSETARVVAGADARYLALAFAVMISGEMLTALKWWYLLLAAGHQIPIRTILWASATGVFYGLFLPGSLAGDAARVIALAMRSCGRAVALASVFMQRNTGLAGLVILANSAVWLHPVMLPPLAGVPPALLDLRAWFGAVTIAYLMVNVLLVSRHPVSVLQHWIRGRGAGLGDWARHSVRRLHRAYLLFIRAVPAAVLLSVMSQMMDCVIVFTLSRALGLDIPFTLFCIAVPAVTLLSLLPVSVGGLGLREIVYLTLLTEAGQGPEAAVALGLTHFLLLFILSLCCGAYLLGHPRSGARD